MKYFFLTLTVFFLLSCELEGLTEEGINIGFRNRTSNKFVSAKLYVGAIKENKFIVTDSIKSKGSIEINNNENDGKIGFGDWNPNLKKVFKIANKGALYCDIKGGLKLFFEPFDKDRFGKFNRFGGSSRNIILNENGTFFYGSTNIEKQDFEVVK